MNIEEAVKKYNRLGFHLVLLEPGRKFPKGDRGRIPSFLAPKELERQAKFVAEKGFNIGLVMIGTLNDRWPFALDFDDPELYEQWRDANPDLAKSPTQKTPNGYHVLLTAGYEFYHGKGAKVSVIADGWYIVVEPSIHPSGESYKWIISPFENEIVHIRNLDEIGLDLDSIDWEVTDYDPHPYSDDGEVDPYYDPI